MALVPQLQQRSEVRLRHEFDTSERRSVQRMQGERESQHLQQLGHATGPVVMNDGPGQVVERYQRYRKKLNIAIPFNESLIGDGGEAHDAQRLAG